VTLVVGHDGAEVGVGIEITRQSPQALNTNRDKLLPFLARD
jgi:hypothetical protein